MGKRELAALLCLSSWCLVIVVRLCLEMPRICLHFVIVVFPDHTHLLFFSPSILIQVIGETCSWLSNDFFFISHNSLYSTHSGFRPNHSCENVRLQMINRFHEAINNGQILGRGGFDLVDNALLLKKLRYYKSQAKHFSDFLNRKQKLS